MKEMKNTCVQEDLKPQTKTKTETKVPDKGQEEKEAMYEVPVEMEFSIFDDEADEHERANDLIGSFLAETEPAEPAREAEEDEEDFDYEYVSIDDIARSEGFWIDDDGHWRELEDEDDWW